MLTESFMLNFHFALFKAHFADEEVPSLPNKKVNQLLLIISMRVISVHLNLDYILFQWKKGNFICL